MQLILIFVLVGSCVCSKTPDRVPVNEVSEPDQKKVEISSSKLPSLPKESVVCEVCKDIVMIIKSQVEIANFSVDMVEALLKGICGPMKLEKMCATISENIDKIFEYLEKNLDPEEICEKLKLCPSKALEAVEKNVQHESIDKCTVCKEVLNLLEFQVKFANATIEELEKFVSELCKTIESEVCLAVLKELDKVYQWIMEGLSPEQICKDLGMCSNSSRISTKPTKESIKPAKESAPCEICMSIMNLVHYDIEYANATIEMVEEVVKDICRVTGSKTCLYILAEWDHIVQWIENGMDPKGICTKLHLCAQRKVTQLPAVNKVKEMNNCTVCQAVVGLVEVMALETKATTSEIQEAVDGLCDVMSLVSKQVLAECNHIKSQLPSIISAIKNKKKSVYEVCADLGYHCQSAGIQTGPVLCENCKIVVNFIQSQIKLANASIQILEKVVMMFCKMFGPEEEKMCNVIISNLDKIIEMLEKGLEPTKICQELGLCPNAVKNQITKRNPYEILV